MRKWIVAHPVKPGALKLTPSWDPPAHALCEAPEHYTDEMEPYFEVTEIPRQPNGFMHTVSVKQEFFVHQAEEKIKQAQICSQQFVAYQLAIKKQEDRLEHNSLSPWQRALFSILGEHARHPRLNSVFKGKLRLRGR